jgi:hypothetical protein
MNIDVILRSPSSMHKWLSTGESRPFSEWLDAWQQQSLKEISTGKDPVELYRAQGRLEVINRILGLKQEVELYQTNVRTGKVQKIS